MSKNIVPLPNAALVQASEVPSLLDVIRPHWQAKSLIVRVRTLLSVDPSSACQRLFNAAIHDLREKIIIAGLDIAREAAKQNRLPPVERAEDVENYSTERIIELAYRIGLLSRPEWRRLSRCYEIRRDLEHEDDEYEAGVEDCIYIFKTCIEVVLSRDPVHLLRVQDLKDVVEQPASSVPANALVEDYRQAPQARQEEILKFLVSTALNADQSDVVRQNAYIALGFLEQHTHNSVKLNAAAALQERIGKKALDSNTARVARAAGLLPYLKKASLEDLFEGVLAQMDKVDVGWRSHTQHGELLRSFLELGGLSSCPQSVRRKILKWIVRTYLGEPGGVTSFGNVRHVYYSDTAAPNIRRIVREASAMILTDLAELRKDKQIAPLLRNSHIARRFEELVDLATPPEA